LNLIRRERAFLMKQLAQLAWLEPLPSETNFLLVRILAPSITSTICGRNLKRKTSSFAMVLVFLASAAATFALPFALAPTING
jgi:histidinol-phosphate/aromatic aminotransferase/cobyric acid decarboxylase-like protein